MVRPPARQSLFATELVAVAAAIAVDTVLAVRLYQPGGSGWWSSVSSVGPAVVVLAVLRRRFPRWVGRLGAAVVGFSLFSSAFTSILSGQSAQPFVSEVLATTLMTGAVCRRLPPARAAALALAAGAAAGLAPVLRYGADSALALAAVPAALMWGGALAVGLILRDADTRHHTAMELVRTNERLQLARELHDLVTHYISGIVVRVQAARSLADRGAAREEPAQVYGEIEQAGYEALAAMRTLVGMLRSDDHAAPLPGTDVGGLVRAAAGTASVDMPEDVETMTVTSDLAGTVHRVVLEAMTNARRHAPGAAVTVAVRRETDDLVLEIDNDHAPGPHREPGYGLRGMSERVAALGGTVTAGPWPGSRWRVIARLPLADTTPRGI